MTTQLPAHQIPYVVTVCSSLIGGHVVTAIAFPSAMAASASERGGSPRSHLVVVGGAGGPGRLLRAHQVISPELRLSCFYLIAHQIPEIRSCV